MDRIKEAHATIMAMYPDLVDKYLRNDVVADLTDATSDIDGRLSRRGILPVRIPHCVPLPSRRVPRAGREPPDCGERQPKIWQNPSSILANLDRPWRKSALRANSVKSVRSSQMIPARHCAAHYSPSWAEASCRTKACTLYTPICRVFPCLNG